MTVDLEATQGRTNYRVPLSRYPGMNRFVLDWLGEKREATAFLARNHASQKHGGAGREALGEALVASNVRWGSFVQDDVRRWVRGESVALIAGQQVGFAGGPLYTLAKLATLIRMKRDLEASGQKATIFFWLATEDHDYEEAATLYVPVSSVATEKNGVNRQLSLLTLRATRAVESKGVVGPAVIPDALIGQLLSLYELERPQWLREGISYRDSFAELIANAIDEPVVLVDALLPELRRAGAPLFERMLRTSDSMQQELRKRSSALTAAGYEPQVVPRPDGKYTLLFRVDQDGERHIIDDGEVGDPATVSTSALTRPLLQDYVFQPAVFVGGPSEVAYYAQIAPLHELLDVAMPRVALRGHVLIGAKRVVRLLARYGIAPQEVFSNPDALLAEREPEGVAEIRQLADAARRELGEKITAIGEIALPAEHALARAINRSIGHIEYHFDKLTERAIRGLVRKDRERYAAARELVATFHPDGHVQDRVVSWFSYWCRFGKHLVDRIVDEIEPDAASFKIIGL